MVTEEIQLEGHIIDSLILSKVLDEILAFGGDFEIKEVQVGQRQGDRSFARIDVSAPNEDQLAAMLAQLARHGAAMRRPEDANIMPAAQDGVFPEGFYSTTNQRTLVRHEARWVDVRRQESGSTPRTERSSASR